MNLTNIKRAIEVLKKIPDEGFEIGDVMRGAATDFRRFVKSDFEPSALACGTAGCLYGWFPAMFPSLYRWDGTVLPVVDRGQRYYSYPVAIAETFDISVDLAYRLSGSTQYIRQYGYEPVTRVMVIDRLQDLLDGTVTESNKTKWLFRSKA